MKNESLKNNMWSVLMHSSSEGFDKKPMIEVAEEVVRSWDATTMIVEKNEEIMIFILSLKGGEKAVEVHVRCDEELHMGIVSCYLPIWLKEEYVKEILFDMNDTLINELHMVKKHVCLQKSFYFLSATDFRFVLSEILGDLAKEISNIYRPLQLLEVAFGVKEEDLEVSLIVDMLMNRVTEEDDDEEDFLDF